MSEKLRLRSILLSDMQNHWINTNGWRPGSPCCRPQKSGIYIHHNMSVLGVPGVEHRRFYQGVYSTLWKKEKVLPFSFTIPPGEKRLWGGGERVTHWVAVCKLRLVLMVRKCKPTPPKHIYTQVLFVVALNPVFQTYSCWNNLYTNQKLL